MSAGVEDNPELRSPTQNAPPTSLRTPAVAPAEGRAGHRTRHHHEHHDHHVLIDAEEDRWRWRRRIRENPRKLFFYRLGVAVAGLLLIVLGFVTGPLPGPGGIPLVLLGLAVWASEFEWAHKVMLRFKALLVRYLGWNRRQQVGFWVAFFLACALLGYLYLLVMGVPSWAPQFASRLLQLLPGL